MDNLTPATVLRVIHDAPASGSWNMAVDEAMFTQVATTGEPILRFYSWQEPTLSLGYFQPHAQRNEHAASLQCPLVRRSSGGGAIVHHYEWTYSIALPLSERWSHMATEVYHWFHQSLCAAMSEFQLQPTMSPVTLHSLAEPFLCFQRRATGDVLLEQQKIAGSAQRRKLNCMLQHGSVLIQQSPAAPELVGWQNLAPAIAPSDLFAAWQRALNIQLASRFEIVSSNWTIQEIATAREWEQKQFLDPHWTTRR